MVSAQDYVQSSSEAHHDHQALLGENERPYLNYRTLSDSGKNVQDPITLLGTELIATENSSAPFGQNDGLLWQGKGLNVLTRGGVQFQALGFSLTIAPQLSFSQNLPFPILDSAYANSYGYIWGYGRGQGADAPQRMGDEPVSSFSWGDSEIRYSWRTVTLGFGTQSPWVGPGRVNSLLHSNNAPPYPKLDFGLRRTPLELGGISLGEVEARLWAGYLSESQYFDSNLENDHNVISFLSLAYVPPFLPGLSLSLNRSFLAPWNTDILATLRSLLALKVDGIGSDDVWDQRLGFAFDYLLPVASIEVYGEVAWNDNPAQNLLGIIRYFGHTAVYTSGMRKAVSIATGYTGELSFEWTNLEMSPIYSQFLWPNSYYMHHQIVQGYTNEGQWLGAGIGTGGNSQHLSFLLFHPWGQASFALWRYNPDNDFITRLTVATLAPEIYFMTNFKAVLAFLIDTNWNVSDHWTFSVGLELVQIQNPLYGKGFDPNLLWLEPDLLQNNRLTASVKWNP